MTDKPPCDGAGVFLWLTTAGTPVPCRSVQSTRKTVSVSPASSPRPRPDRTATPGACHPNGTAPPARHGAAVQASAPRRPALPAAPRPSAPKWQSTPRAARPWCAAPSAVSAGTRSSLFQTSSIGAVSATPRSRRIFWTSPACSSVFGWLMSRTCTIRSASSTSSSVARKAATNCVGRSLMKPTVSDKITSVPSGRLTARIVGSSVAKSMSLAITSAPVRWLNSVDFPALV